MSMSTTPEDAIAALVSALSGVSGLTADSVKYGVFAKNPITGPCLTLSLARFAANEDSGTLRSEEIAATFEVRIYAPSVADTPRARETAAMTIWIAVRAALYADKTLGGVVRNVRLGEMTPPAAAADIGEPGGGLMTMITLVWSWRAV